ncbi:MAG: hypothetical protein Q4A52_04635, partial [Bacillota bacterium]|nr:hypothetical protein [Bacillota bacterium]
MEKVQEVLARNYDKALFRRRAFHPERSEMLSDTNYSYWQSTIRTFWKAKTSRVLIVVIAVLVLYSFVYPLVSRVDPNQVSLDTEQWNMKASPGHWFGTDALGRDIWSRTWTGTRNSLV